MSLQFISLCPCLTFPCEVCIVKVPSVHDCHLRITPHKQQRFEEAFGSRSVAMLNIHGIVFVLLNSMAMEGDGCEMCRETVRALHQVSRQLQCAKVSAQYSLCDVVLFSLWSLCGLCTKCLGTAVVQGQYSLCDVVLFSLWSLHGHRIKCFSSCSGPRSVVSSHCVMLYCFHCGHFMGTESSVSAAAVGHSQCSVLTV